MTASEYLKMLQDEAVDGFNKRIGHWVDDNSAIATALNALGEIQFEKGLF